MPWSYKGLCVAFRGDLIKDQLAPWRSEVVTGSYQAGLEALGKALQNYSAARKARCRVGFPGFRAKGRSHETAGTSSSTGDSGRCARRSRCASSRAAARLGPARAGHAFHGPTRQWWLGHQLHCAAVSQAAPRTAPRGGRPRRANNPGNYHLDGRAKEGCRAWVKSRRMQRTEQRIATLHERVANLRREQAHQLTTALTREFGVIGVETLAVKNLMGNRRLARQIADVGWGAVPPRRRARPAAQ